MATTHFIARTFTDHFRGLDSTVPSRVERAVDLHGLKLSGPPILEFTDAGFEAGQHVHGRRPGAYSGFVGFKDLPKADEQPRKSTYFTFFFAPANSGFEAGIEDAVNRRGWSLYGRPDIASDGKDVFALQALTRPGETWNKVSAEPRFVTLYRLPVGLTTSETCKLDEGMRNAGWHTLGDQAHTTHQGKTVLAPAFIKKVNGPYQAYDNDLRQDLAPLRNFLKTDSAVVARSAPGG